MICKLSADGTRLVGRPKAILKNTLPWEGPLVDGPDGHAWFVYHAWKAGHVGGKGNPRMLLLDRIEWKNGWPKIGDGRPSNGPRVAPSA